MRRTPKILRRLCRIAPAVDARPRTSREVCEFYWRDYGESVEQDQRWFSACKGRTAIERAAGAVLANGKLHPHQWRVGRATLSLWVKALLKHEHQIEHAANFHELHQAISNAKIAGVGELTIYDTAHRLGLARGLLPQQVYVHAGVRRGARALGLGAATRIEMHKLPAPLNRLSPAAAEDVLCIYKDDLARIRMN